MGSHCKGHVRVGDITSSNKWRAEGGVGGVEKVYSIVERDAVVFREGKLVKRIPGRYGLVSIDVVFVGKVGGPQPGRGVARCMYSSRTFLW